MNGKTGKRYTAQGLDRSRRIALQAERFGEGLDRVAFTSAYFTSKDPQGLLRSLPNYAKARYREIWPGIDVVYYGNRDKLEYDLVLAPHADPRSNP
jgi:hypothetical protein